MKVYITCSKIIFNPAPTEETDAVIRGPKDSKKVLVQYKNYSKHRFSIRTVQRESKNTVSHISSSLLQFESMEDAVKEQEVLSTYLTHNKWNVTEKNRQGGSVWKHPKLTYLMIVVEPAFFNKLGAAFRVESIGYETEEWRRNERRKKGNLGPRTNKLHESILRKWR